MTDRRISLTLVLHNHQPVGNFGFVLEDNFRAAYQPMLAALERHPRVRLGLHYTGPLLDWFKAYRPEALDRLRALIGRGQVEILGGGYYEPVLASLPEADRVGQLTRMADELESLFGRRPQGAWLAERVWEPDVPTSLAAAGYQYTIVDDAHFRAAAIPAERHWGSYSTDDQGHRVIVYGSEQGLRYRIPFRPVEDVIDYLHEHATEAGELVGMMGDDGEKFGTWPGTWELCHGEGQWVERFFTALEENADWLRLLQPAEALVAHPPIGRVYLPTGSYAEMGEWSLPVEARREFTHLLHEAVEEGRPEARWMRGGFWRSFQVNYREINDLHKQMLRASRKVAALRPQAGAARAGAIAGALTGTDADPGPGPAGGAGPAGARGRPGVRSRRSSWRASPTTSTRASRTIATGTGSSAACTCRTCAWPLWSTSSPPRMPPTGLSPDWPARLPDLPLLAPRSRSQPRRSRCRRRAPAPRPKRCRCRRRAPAPRPSCRRPRSRSSRLTWTSTATTSCS